MYLQLHFIIFIITWVLKMLTHILITHSLYNARWNHHKRFELQALGFWHISGSKLKSYYEIWTFWSINIIQMTQTISWLVLNLILEGIIEWNLQWPVISESLIWATLLQVGSRENGNAGHDYKREDFISSNFWCSRNEYLGVGRKVLQLAS